MFHFCARVINDKWLNFSQYLTSFKTLYALRIFRICYHSIVLIEILQLFYSINSVFSSSPFPKNVLVQIKIMPFIALLQNGFNSNWPQFSVIIIILEIRLTLRDL